MTNKTYDFLRWVQVILPLFGSLYYSLSGIWGLPYGKEIVATVSALTGFLGALLKYSSAQYWKETDTVNVHDEGID